MRMPGHARSPGCLPRSTRLSRRSSISQPPGSWRRDKPWYEQRLPVVEDRVRDRLGELSGRLGDADWLDGAFSAGDLMMVAVLLRLKASGMLDEYPNLSAYVARGEARPAYSVLSTLNWRSSLASHRPADEGPRWAHLSLMA